MIYTSERVWREELSNLPAPDLIESPLWLKHYPFNKGPARRDVAVTRIPPPVPIPWGDSNWWIHQYQGDAIQLPGFAPGNVDMNRFGPMTAGASSCGRRRRKGPRRVTCRSGRRGGFQECSSIHYFGLGDSRP
ncbi:MAG: hypothetical protein WBQ64_06175 [Terriglobales bacterium]